MTAPLVVSLSGGKDSTAMLLMMLERGESIHSVIYFDAGEWEFPQMHEHIDRLEEYVGMKFVRLAPKRPFLEQMTATPVVIRKGERKGEVRFLGRGWPSPLRRWCTRNKAETIDKWTKANVKNPVRCVGFASDEIHRTTRPKLLALGDVRFPLVEWSVSEANALAYCFSHGFSWGGLYEHFNRVSCFCCPLQKLKDLRKLRRHFPDLWSKMLNWEQQMQRPWEHRRFYQESTVRDLDARFREEDRQLKLPGCAA